MSTRRTFYMVLTVLLLFCAALAQNSAGNAPASESFSGMYTFLKDGEFVQITVEDAGKVTGFISRYGDGESDRGAFLDQFFKEGKLDSGKLSFATQTVHGVWFDFKGAAERGEGRTPSEDGYHVLKGTLTEYRNDANGRPSSQARTVTFKSFPQNLGPPAPH